MARHARAHMHHVNQAEVEGAIASYFGVSATTPGIGELARVVFTGVQEASRGNPAAWRSVVLGVLANHIGMAQGLGLQGSELQRQLQIMRGANRTSADFVNALRAVQTLVAGMGGWNRVARAVEGGERLPNSSTYTALGSGYAADRLPVEMRRYVDRYGAHHVAAVGNYLNELGMHAHDVQRYAGFFVGSSETVRHAIRSHIRSGQALTDEHVTSAADARAIMGAIRAGRIKPEDAPPSVRRLMERMEREGIDPSTADPSRIQQFFEQNPSALEEAKRVVAADITATAPLSDRELLARIEAGGNGQGPPAIVLGAAPSAPQPLPVRAPSSSEQAPEGQPAPPSAPAPPSPQVVPRTLG